MSNLVFIKTDSVEPAAQKLSDFVLEKLDNDKKVLLLLSGGSSVEVARKLLANTGSSNLILAQVDERYGPLNHPDSNWPKLVNSLEIDSNLKTFPILTGKKFKETVSAYNDKLNAHFNEVDYIAAVLGIGADGHTAGILPECEALDSQELVAGYEGPDFTRITITPRAIGKIDMAVVFAKGESKRPALESLDSEAEVSKQPAQLLKKIKNVFIYNDQIGG